MMEGAVPIGLSVFDDDDECKKQELGHAELVLIPAPWELGLITPTP